MRYTRAGVHVVLVAVLALLPFALTAFGAHIANLALIYVILAVGLSVALGHAGQVNLAQAACFGIGAYTTALVTLHTGIGWWGALPLSIATAGGLGLLISIPSLRVQSHYLGIVTLGLALSFTAVLTNWEFAGQAIGLPGVEGPKLGDVNFADEKNYYYLILVCMLVVFGLALLMMRTALGRRFKAMRDDYVAAMHSGIEVPIYRMIAFMLSAAFAGVAGALYAGMIHYVSPDTYSLAIMFLLLAMVIIGGRDNLYGAAFGAALLIYVRQRFVELQQYQQVGYGALIVAMVVFAPSGLAGVAIAAWRRITPTTSLAEATLDDLEVEGLGADEGRLTSVATGNSPVIDGKRVLEIRNVTKRFKGIVALDDVTIDVAAGTIHGIVGPNGSGKTTLFNVVTGVYGPTSGSVALHGRRISGRRAYNIERLGVARTFQGVRLFRTLTVRENVMVALDDSRPYSIWRYVLAPWLVLMRERDLRQRADGHLRRYRLGSVADFRGTNLPYGQQRLVEIARAMASGPKLLLLDEPAAGLNSTEMRDLGDLIRGIRDSGVTVVLIEHNMGLVMSLCERVTVLASGRVLAEGDPETISQDPDVIEAYLGSSTRRDVQESLA